MTELPLRTKLLIDFAMAVLLLAFALVWFSLTNDKILPGTISGLVAKHFFDESKQIGRQVVMERQTNGSSSSHTP